MPFIGSAIAIIFYDHVFVKSQEFMMDDDEEEEGLRLEDDADTKHDRLVETSIQDE